jgi:hypothetical protein
MFPIPRSIRSDLLTLSHVSRDHTDQSDRTSSSNSTMTDAKASGLALLTCRRVRHGEPPPVLRDRRRHALRRLTGVSARANRGRRQLRIYLKY